MSATRLQDEYNAKVRNCDIFVSLFRTKTGKFTDEEFDSAHEAFMEKGKPLIFTFFHDADINMSDISQRDMQSVWAFQQKLKDLGHFWTTYKNIEDLKLRFKNQIRFLLDDGKL